MAGQKLSSSTAVVQAVMEPGDRIEVGHAGPKQLRLPAETWMEEVPFQSLEDAQGQALLFTFNPVDGLLTVPELSRALPERFTALWLECREPGQFRLVVEATAPSQAETELTTEQGLRLIFDPSDWELLRTGSGRHRASLAEFDLALRAARLATHAGFDRLICLPMVRDMELLEHQIRTAKTVLQRFRGRALLCDEVGLGKTIEAGLVMSELVMRGLARSVLVLTPPSLIEQWQGEMRRKFSLELTNQDDPAFRQMGADAWKHFDRVIVSLHTAKREPHRSAILAREWDLVIVDEAHHLRNRTTQMWKFASELRKQFILLLTATPVQNNLDELFNLVTLLEPGLLSTAKQFQRRFVDRKDKLTPKNVNELHALLGEVMVRNRRSTVGLQFTRRFARTDRVALTANERTLYNDVTRFVRLQLRSSGGKLGITRMALIALQMAMGSSSQAAAGTLRKIAEQPKLPASDRTRLVDLADRALAQRENTKVDRLIGLLGEFDDKMVIFTQFRATQELIQRRLTEAGHKVAVFHGGLSRLEKEAAVERFRGPARLLLCTEAGSEGRNLQFAHAVCNFDLPWNPMKIEQRIGRLSRIGQTHDVHVFNLVAANTVEAAVLHLLEAKLNMFELVIGEVDMILGNLDDEREFQDVVADLWAESSDHDDFAHRIDDLGNRLLEAKRAYFEQRALDDKLFGNRFAPDQ